MLQIPLIPEHKVERNICLPKIVYVTAHIDVLLPAKPSSNKGALSKRDAFIAYTGDHFYVTKPFLDKITLLGTPYCDLTGMALQLTATLDRQAKDNSSYFAVDLHRFSNSEQRRRTRYKYHYQLTVRGTNEHIKVFFEPVGLDCNVRRFLKLEFNPSKLGPENIKKLKQWYNITFPESSFQDLISQKKCVGHIHIAVDIVGVHIKTLLLNYKAQAKSHQWRSKKGELETYYMNAEEGKQTALKIYNKRRKAKQTGETLPYGKGMPVTRIEKIIRTEHSLLKLPSLKSTHFKYVPLYFPSDPEQYPELKHHWTMFLETFRSNGMRRTLEVLPEELRPAYEEALKKCTENIFFPYNRGTRWREWWTDSLKDSGLLP